MSYLDGTPEIINTQETHVNRSLKDHKCRYCGKVLPAGTRHLVVKQLSSEREWFSPRFCNRDCYLALEEELCRFSEAVDIHIEDVAHGDNTCYVRHF